jgi:hypothetical protein
MVEGKHRGNSTLYLVYEFVDNKSRVFIAAALIAIRVVTQS